jgi:hypothetical protein
MGSPQDLSGQRGHLDILIVVSFNIACTTGTEEHGLAHGGNEG